MTLPLWIFNLEYIGVAAQGHACCNPTMSCINLGITLSLYSGSTTWACSALLGAFTYLLWRYICRPSLNLPPGPKRLPILGNIHQITEEYQEVTFAQWAQQYGIALPSSWSIAMTYFLFRRSHVCRVLHAAGPHYQLSEDSKRPSGQTQQDLLEPASAGQDL